MTASGWGPLIIEWHAPAAYIFAVVFPTLRWARRKMAGHGINLGSILHQAGTGFVVPAFAMLCASYGIPALAAQVSPHELGIAGLFAILTSLRELCVDGVDEENAARSSRWGGL